MTFTSGEVRQYYAARVPLLKINSSREWRGPCPIHQGTNPSFAVNSETGLAQCHSACGRGWDMISFEMEMSGLDFVRAKEAVFEMVGRPNIPWAERDLESTYDYADEQGKTLYQVLRYYGKKFKQRRPAADGTWIWKLGDVKLVPFRLPQMLNSKFAAICEGEKDVLTLEHLGMVATCNNGGAGNFKAEIVPHFASKDVAIFPDYDDPGRKHALQVAELLAPVAKSIKIVELPGLSVKGDVTDFVNAGGTVDSLRDLYKKAQAWTSEWDFSIPLPEENDPYIRTIVQEIEAAGGLNEFWNLAKFIGMPTPFPRLNWVLGGGMRDGEVYVIGANQGAGKTSLALQFALAVLHADFAALIFSMEMGWRAIFQRMAGIEARVDLAEYRISQLKNRVNPEDRLRLARATGEIAQWKLQVSTKSAVTPEYILNETKRLAKRTPVDFVIVDHMQLMGADKGVRGDYEKFTSISRAMKQTAVDVDVPLLLVSQTSRSNSRERRAELEVSDFRGSGAIEEDAAGCFLLFEDHDDAQKALAVDSGRRYLKGPVKTFLKVGKNRYGMQRVYLPLLHFKGLTRFDMIESDAPVEETC